MAHGKRPGAISKTLAPEPPPCPGLGPAAHIQEEERDLVSETSEQRLRSLNDGENAQVTPHAPANQYYTNSDPSHTEDMEDTCSEYDNVGSDVEQDYDEVLHLNREGLVDTRYYKQYCPEEGGYIKRTEGDDINENQLALRPRHSSEMCEGSESDPAPHKASHCSRPHCAPAAGVEAERGVEKGQENRFFFSDGDEIEEVLDGAKFIEDLEETESSVQRQQSLYQDNENKQIRKGGDERERVDDTRVARHHNIPAGGKKPMSSHVASKEKERQGKGRGRRVAVEDVERGVSGIKGCPSNGAEQRPKASSRECKKAAARIKARSGSGKQQQHPPPPPRHPLAQAPANNRKARPHREAAPAPALRVAPAAAATAATTSQDCEPRAVKPPQAHHDGEEPQREPPEDRQRQEEKPQLASQVKRGGFVADLTHQWLCCCCCCCFDFLEILTHTDQLRHLSVCLFRAGRDLFSMTSPSYNIDC